MTSRAHGALKACLFLIAALAFGCVTGVESGTQITSSDQLLAFSGIAYGPNELIEIEAYNKKTKKWDVLGTTRSYSQGTRFGYEPEVTMYGWSKHIRLSDFDTGSEFIEPWMCYFHELCFVSGVETKLSFRVRSDGPLQIQYTFAQGGVKCMADRIGTDKSVVESYDECKPQAPYNTGEITIIKPQGIGGYDF